MTTRFLKTETGVFKVTVKEDENSVIGFLNNHIPTLTKNQSGVTINIGSKNLCIFIKAPNNSSDAYFGNIITREKCEDYEEFKHGKLIRGPETIFIMNLGFTILKETAPHIKTVTFEDNSVFTCNFDSTKTFEISVHMYELMFFQSTWYEQHFQATLINQDYHATYIEAKNGFTKPKPKTYRFSNNHLHHYLTPIYERTTTWKEFFDEIYKLDNRLKVIFVWYKGALSEFFHHKGYLWAIDIYNSSVKTIQYDEIQDGAFDNLMEHDGIYYNQYNETNHIKNDEIHTLVFTKDDFTNT